MSPTFSRSAVQDLARLRAFIAQHNPTAAKRISERLRGAILGLTNHPRIGRPVLDLPGEIRELTFGKYAVRYQAGPDEMFIPRVWHRKEDR